MAAPTPIANTDAWERAADDTVADALLAVRDAAELGDHLAARRAALELLRNTPTGDEPDARAEAARLYSALGVDPVAVVLGALAAILIATVAVVTVLHHAPA